MAKWAWLEDVTAITLGCVGIAAGDLGTSAVGAVSGAKLIGAWRDAKSRNALDSAALMRRIRREVRREFERWVAHERTELAEIDAADRLIASDIEKCIPDIAAIAELSLKPGEFKTAVAGLILEGLAQRHPVFRPTGQPGASNTSREFAKVMIEAAVGAALADDAYRSRLLPYMTAAIAQELARVSETASRILRQIVETHSDLRALLDQVPDLALRREIMQLVGAHPAAGTAELAGDVARFAREYRELLAELASFRSEDNQLRGAEQAAEEALLQGDLFRARRYLAEAASIARQRATASVRELSRLLDREARLALLDRDWSSAEKTWEEASKNLDVLDAASGAYVASQAALALGNFGDRFGDVGALNASRKMWEALVARCGDVESIDLAHYLMGLGGACQRQAQRMQGVEGVVLLEHAIDMYRRAAAMYREFRQTEAWASAQSNVGAACYSRGAQALEADWDHFFEEAREAYEAALSVWTRQDWPEKWAGLQCALGLVARARGDRLEGDEKMELLQRAVTHHRLAVESNAPPENMEEYLRHRHYLSTALFTLADARPPPAGLHTAREAVSLLRATLAMMDRKEFPGSWAAATFSLGGALWIEVKQSEDSPDALAKLKEAEDAYWSAATIWSAENYPRYYAIIEQDVAGLKRLMERIAKDRR